MKINKASIIIFVVAIFLTTSTMAISLPVNQSNGATKITLDTEAAQLSVEAPLSLPFTLSKNGDLVVPQKLTLVNNSYAPVVISSITATAMNSWSLVDFTTDFSNKTANTKEIAFKIDGKDVSKTISTSEYEISSKAITTNTLDIPLTGVNRIALQRTAVAAQQIAEIVFVFDFK